MSMLILPKTIIKVLCQQKVIKHSTYNVYRCIKTSSLFRAESSEKSKQDDNSKQDQKQKYNEELQKSLIVRGLFNDVEDKSKTTYLDMVRIFENRDVHRRGHVEFIYAALRNMEDYNVHRDLEVYKALVDVMPKGKFIPTNMFQAEFMHYPKQQQCIIDLLEQMEDNGVMPDAEMENILINVFGRRGHPVRKYWRMMYWMPKFKNLSPWSLPNPVPNETLELAKLAMERMVSVDLQTKIAVYQTSDVESALDDTWIVSGQSVEQMQLLEKHEKLKPLHIEGPFLIWLRNKSINYFTLRGDPTPTSSDNSDVDLDDVSNLEVPHLGKPSQKYQVGAVRSVHEQDDGTIFGICITGTSTKDSLLSWIRLLENDGNPNLATIPILFKFRQPVPTQLIIAE